MRGKRHKIQKRLQKSQGLAALVAVQEDIEEAVNETTRQMAELPEELSGCSGAHLLGTVIKLRNGCLRRSRVFQKSHESMA
jgi:hypothetical protein